MIGVKLHVESLSLTVQMTCLTEAFWLSPSSEVFYFKKKEIKNVTTLLLGRLSPLSG